MPNGVSCAYFAARNLVYGKKEQNLFKEGIAGAQTIRTVDALTNADIMTNIAPSSAKSFFGKAANFVKKLLYPLIIASGIYNTAIAEDKVKTGASQAGGIASMYVFEQVAEKGLNKINTKLLNTNAAKNNKFVRVGLYVAKGIAYAASSIAGYTFGSKGAESIVDAVRKTDKKVNSAKTIPFPIDKDLSKNNIDGMLFEDMKL